MVPEEQVAAFKQEMERLGAEYRFVAYPGATHGFTNPGADAFAERFGLPIAHHPEADRKSWEEMCAFLENVLAK